VLPNLAIDMNLDNQTNSQSLQKYQQHLQVTMNWLVSSFEKNQQGSKALIWAFGKWAKPYPETTGYIIPTLLDYADFIQSQQHRDYGYRLGEWLLKIQDADGYWHGGTHPPKKPNPSVFNSAQILIGLCALYRDSQDSKWLEAANRSALWLSQTVDNEGNCSVGNYQSGFTPSYYTRVAWPMLEVWKLNQNDSIRQAAERMLARIKDKQKDKGVIAGWGFKPDDYAFTHTIAYTLRGFIESARIVDDWQAWGQVVELAIEQLIRKSELASGRLPGAFDESWQAKKEFTCLTGNAQLAICFLQLNQREPDLRLVNAAAKLVDTVCSSQRLSHPIAAFRGAVAGSQPIWGKYMTMRFPNWAAKFHCDALLLLMQTLKQEGLQ